MSNTPQYHDKKRLDKFSRWDRLSSVKGKRTKELRERLDTVFERDNREARRCKIMQRWDRIVSANNENFELIYQFGYISPEDSSFNVVGATYAHSDAVLCSKAPEMYASLQNVVNTISDFLAGTAGDYDLQVEAEKINDLLKEVKA